MTKGGTAYEAGDYEITFRKVADLIPYQRNSRTHSDEQVAKIMASLAEFGWTNPALLDGSNGLIAGHGRALAALRLYEQGRAIRLPNGKDLPQGMIPTLDCSGWSEAQKRAYIIADNALAAEAGWDAQILRLELDDLVALDFNIDLLGFSADNLAAALGPNKDVNEGLTDPDDVPATPNDPVTLPGDVWRMGSHRLVCGDSTDADVVAKCLNGVTPPLMVTDPPYGVSYDANWRNEPEKLNLKSTTDLGGVGAKNRNATTGKVLNDNRADWTEAWALFPGNVAYVWHGERQGPDLVQHFRSCGFEPRNLIVWAKDGLVISRGHYHPEHEGCWYLVRKGKTGNWHGDRKQSTLWRIPKNRKNETGHSTQKPVECMKRPIENNSSPGQAVYEPFSGSGTTIIAGEMIGRGVHAIELSPAYVDVAVTRWQEFTGQTATLEATGQTFVELLAERVPNALIKVQTADA